MTALVPFGDRGLAGRSRNLPAPFPVDPEQRRHTRGALEATTGAEVDLQAGDDTDRPVGEPEVGCDDPWRVRQPTDWRRLGRTGLIASAVAAGAGTAYAATHLTSSVAGPAGLLAAAVTGTTAVLVANIRRGRLDPTRQPTEHTGPSEVPAPGTDLEVAGWVWRCRPCATVSIEVVTDTEADHLAAVHDRLHHGAARTAAITNAPTSTRTRVDRPALEAAHRPGVRVVVEAVDEARWPR